MLLSYWQWADSNGRSSYESQWRYAQEMNIGPTFLAQVPSAFCGGWTQLATFPKPHISLHKLRLISDTRHRHTASTPSTRNFNIGKTRPNTSHLNPIENGSLIPVYICWGFTFKLASSCSEICTTHVEVVCVPSLPVMHLVSTNEDLTTELGCDIITYVGRFTVHISFIIRKEDICRYRQWLTGF